MADSTTPPGYASDPELSILWGPPPAFTGVAAAGGASRASAPAHNAISVSLASVQAAEQSLLTAAAAIIAAYNPLDQQVHAAISGGTIFGQQATYHGIYIQQSANQNPHPQAGPSASHEFDEPDAQLNKAAIEFAASMNPTMTRVLRMIADATEAMGVFIAMLDKAGQAYATADRNSVFPVPTPAPAPPPA